ncbi:MAG: hypothetical protein NTU88_03180, partial [Armatimonadetes bacterium]|nr:hypothetical protein [Armatimonadota bacterium]
MSGLDDLTREELKVLALELHEMVQRQAERISELEEEVARLRGSRPGGLAIKPSVKRQEKKPRKRRARSFARHSLAATEIVYHAVDSCPDCGRKLIGGSVKWRHQ